ncbi:MAG: family 43 glycosylhydrolase, partial [Lachnospiraceae bacterium]
MTSSEILIRDPFVLPYQGKYYLYGTRSETAFAKEAFGFDVYVSDDLKNWSAPAECFHRPEGFWAVMHYWAPEVHLYQNAFYMFATFSDGKRQGT